VYFFPTFSDTTVAIALKQKFLSAAALAGMLSFLLEKFLLFLVASMLSQRKFLLFLQAHGFSGLLPGGFL
jgi:hypothetical protein